MFKQFSKRTFKCSLNGGPRPTSTILKCLRVGSEAIAHLPAQLTVDFKLIEMLILGNQQVFACAAKKMKRKNGGGEGVLKEFMSKMKPTKSNI